jgi:crotonobetainyl-CoA:carnitine CoA-transferase CaiB-like acyl-CoA transferase
MPSHDSASQERAALKGIRVLDLADNAVAYASRLLADLGAEVIRIEPPAGNGAKPSTRKPSRSISSASMGSACSAIWPPRAM